MRPEVGNSKQDRLHTSEGSKKKNARPLSIKTNSTNNAASFEALGP